MGKKRKSGSNVKLIIGLGAVAAAGYLWLRSQVKLISFGSVSVPFQQLKSGRLNLGLRLPIINASAIGARVTGFVGFIVAPSGATIGTVFLKNPVKVAPYAQSNLEFMASIGLTDILSEAGSGVFSDTLPTSLGAVLPYLKKFKLVGQVRIYGIPVPIEMPLV